MSPAQEHPVDQSPGGDLAILIALCDGLLEHTIPMARKSAKTSRSMQQAVLVYRVLKQIGGLLATGIVGLILLWGWVGKHLALIMVGGAEVVLAVLLFYPRLARRRVQLTLELSGDEEQLALYSSVEQINSFSRQLDAWGLRDPHLEAVTFDQLERQTRHLRRQLLDLRG